MSVTSCGSNWTASLIDWRRWGGIAVLFFRGAVIRIVARAAAAGGGELSSPRLWISGAWETEADRNLFRVVVLLATVPADTVVGDEVATAARDSANSPF